MKSTDSAPMVPVLWPLPSGTWKQLPSAPALVPMTTAAGDAVAPEFFPAQWQMSMRYAQDSATPGAVFPPEFRFHPDTGVPLQMHSPKPDCGDWVAPHGQHGASDSTYGLPQTGHRLLLTRDRERRDTDEPDRRLPAPPRGEYEFFSLPCATDGALLLALERSKGLLYCYFDALAQWVQLLPDGILLNECHGLPDSAWGAVSVAVDATQRCLFLPTDEGLACLHAHAPALRYRVVHIGQGRVVGAPIVWSGRVWALLAQDGQLRVLSCTETGDDIAWQEAPSLPVECDYVSEMLPIADPRNLVWLGTALQIHLHRHGAGDVRVQVIAWPAPLQPQFAFGPPCLTKDGSLWQLCQDQNTRSYHYLKLLTLTPESEFAELPRLSVGRIHYRYSQQQSNAPWEELTAGDDGSQTRVFVPLFEAPKHGQVLGLQLDKATQGLAEVLRSKERQRAFLTLDAGRFITFGQISVSTPCNVRCFVHNHFLWAFHPQLSDIQGWELCREENV